MKSFHYEYPWTTTEEWLLPSDEEMMQNQFPILDEQVDAVLTHVHQMRNCVQAGGAMGMYPLRLAYFFDKVFTFEPVPANLHCLVANVEPHIDNIVISDKALMDVDEQPVVMTYSKPKLNSYGAHHVSRSGKKGWIAMGITLDSLELSDVDLIWLDIEGAESLALAGAEATVERCSPTIVIEDRQLPGMKSMGTRPGQGAAWLTAHGYRLTGSTHADTIWRRR